MSNRDGSLRDEDGYHTDLKITNPDYDLPKVPLKQVVVMASSQRSGSSMLSAQLASTSCVGVPREYLNPLALANTSIGWGLPRQSFRGHLGQIRRRIRGNDDWRNPVRFTNHSVGEYLRLLADRRTTANGVFSMKAHWNHWEKGFLNTGQQLDLWNAPISWVRLTRTDLIAQAISLSRARQSGQWSSHMAATKSASYDEARIVRCIEVIEYQTASWDRYFQSLGVEPYVVHYESLVESTTATVSGLLGWLGFPDARPAPPSTRRQSGTESAEWHARFLKNHPEYAHRTGQQ